MILAYIEDGFYDIDQLMFAFGRRGYRSIHAMQPATDLHRGPWHNIVSSLLASTPFPLLTCSSDLGSDHLDLTLGVNHQELAMLHFVRCIACCEQAKFQMPRDLLWRRRVRASS
jgi:hypothetical protein